MAYPLVDGTHAPARCVAAGGLMGSRGGMAHEGRLAFCLLPLASFFDKLVVMGSFEGKPEHFRWLDGRAGVGGHGCGRGRGDDHRSQSTSA